MTCDRSSPLSTRLLFALADTLTPSSESANAIMGMFLEHSPELRTIPATMPTTVSLISDPASNHWMNLLSLRRWLSRM